MTSQKEQAGGTPIPLHMKTRLTDAMKASRGGAERPAQAIAELTVVARKALLDLHELHKEDGLAEYGKHIKKLMMKNKVAWTRALQEELLLQRAEGGPSAKTPSESPSGPSAPACQGEAALDPDI